MNFFGQADVKENYSLDALTDKGILTRLSDELFMLRKTSTYDTEGGILGLEFAFFEVASMDTDENVLELELVMHGSGQAGNLRECRHTYWGNNGYIFYPSGPNMMAIFKALSEYFDDMV